MAPSPGLPFTRSTRFSRLVHVVECTSTQDLALADRDSGCAVFWADHQTRGRGRQGRVWYDEAALDLAVTFRVHDVRLPHPARLPVVVPIVVAEAVEEFAPVRPTFEWPNDVMLGGRKLAGILIDAEGAPPVYAIGVGINVGRTRFPDELMDSATSLALATGGPVDRASLLDSLARGLDAALNVLTGGDVTPLAEAFRDRTDLLRREVVLESRGRTERGHVASLDLDRIVFHDGRAFPLALVQGLRRGH